MARPLRIEYPGAVYHNTSRGNEKKALFKGDQDRINFLNTPPARHEALQPDLSRLLLGGMTSVSLLALTF